MEAKLNKAARRRNERCSLIQWGQTTAAFADIDSTRHALELRHVERLIPFQPALGEHLEFRRDQFGPVQAAEHDEDEAGKTFQID